MEEKERHGNKRCVQDDTSKHPSSPMAVQRSKEKHSWKYEHEAIYCGLISDSSAARLRLQ